MKTEVEFNGVKKDIVDLLDRYGNLSHSELVNKTGKSDSTVHDAADYLQEHDIIYDAEGLGNATDYRLQDSVSVERDRDLSKLIGTHTYINLLEAVLLLLYTFQFYPYILDTVGSMTAAVGIGCFTVFFPTFLYNAYNAVDDTEKYDVRVYRVSEPK